MSSDKILPTASMSSIVLLLFLLVVPLAFSANQNRTFEAIGTTVTIAEGYAPEILSISFDDEDTSDNGAYLDPLPNSTNIVTCDAIVRDLDGENNISWATAILYNVSNGYEGDEIPRIRYINKSCTLDVAYGTTEEVAIQCTFSLQFYASPGSWTCLMNVSDGIAETKATANEAILRPLLAMDFDSSQPLNFGTLRIGENTSTIDFPLEIKNIGNIPFDLSLTSYGASDGDGLAMVCTSGTLAAEDLRYSLLPNTPYSQRTSLSSSGSVEEYGFNLLPQSSGTTATSSFLYFGFGIAPTEFVSGSCTGTLMITAIEDQ